MMRNSLTELCGRFIEERDRIRGVFSWENTYMYPVCASIFLHSEKGAEEESLKYCRDLLKKETGIFSGFRGNAKLPVICMMAADRDPEGKLQKGLNVYRELKEHFFASEYLSVASMMIADVVRKDRYEEIAKRTRRIYDLMKQEHPFLTSGEDSVFAAMLAMSGLSDRMIVSETESCYDILKETFYSSNAVQSLSHVLALCEGVPKEKCRRTVELFEALKKRGRRYGTGYELATLGVLAMLPENQAGQFIESKSAIDDIAEDVVSVDEFLSGQKGYGALGIGRKQRLMHAGMLVIADYVKNYESSRKEAENASAEMSADTVGAVNHGSLMNTAALGGTISLVAAQQAALCAAIVVSSTAAANASS